MDRRDFIRLSLQAGALAMLQVAAGCKFGGQSAGPTVTLAPLPYAENALEPHLSARTLSFTTANTIGPMSKPSIAW